MNLNKEESMEVVHTLINFRFTVLKFKMDCFESGELKEFDDLMLSEYVTKL